MSENKGESPQNTESTENSASSESAINWQSEAEKFKNDFLYLRAEFENYKRHAVKERSELLRYAGERLARDIVGVVDNFERALGLDVKPDTLDNYVKGVQLTAQELKTVLEKHGIKAVESDRVPFDPNIHEALGSEPSTEVAEGHVLRVFEKPYRYHDKLLRVGRVVIAKKQEG
ncbi:MAG: nucleotide exchange factor GrpE [Bdellovibrionales bacterium]